MKATAQSRTDQAAAEYSFAKDKLPKSLSYPLKRSLLDAALRQASVYDAVWYVHYSGHQYENEVMRAHFHPEDAFAASAGKTMLTVWAVPSTDRRFIEELMVREGLPILCDWLARTKDAGNAWRGMVHIIDFRRIGENLKVIELAP